MTEEIIVEKSKSKKKLYIIVSIVAFIVVISLIMFFGDSSKISFTLLDNNITLSEKECGLFKDNTLIYSSSCSACQKALSILKDYENITYLEIDKQETIDLFHNNSVVIKSIPVFIHECKVYVGLLDRSKYEEMIK